MKVVFLSTNDQLGGAAIVTMRLVEALRSAGVDARMVVGRKDGTDDYVAQVGQTRRKVAKVLERGEVFINNGFDMGDLWKVSTGSFGADVCGHPWVRDADVIVLGWINQGFLSLPQLKKLGHTGKPVFGRLLQVRGWLRAMPPAVSEEKAGRPFAQDMGAENARYRPKPYPFHSCKLLAT